jgi:hypothetical protein
MTCSRRQAFTKRRPDEDPRGVYGHPASTMHHQHERHLVSCEIEGETFTGKYWVAGMILVVSTANGGTSTQLANREPAALAKTLLRDFILAGKG